MNGNATFFTVVAKQSFDCLTIEWPSVSSVPPFVGGIRFPHNKEVIGVKSVVQEQLIKQCHQFR